MILKIALALALAVIVATGGDILMSIGLKRIGKIEVTGLASLWQTFLRIVGEWRIVAAVGLMCTFFCLWMSILSRADLSLALPITALTYVLNAFLAKPLLGEKVSLMRWIGTLIIFVGVIVVVIGDYQTNAVFAQPSAGLFNIGLR